MAKNARQLQTITTTAMPTPMATVPAGAAVAGDCAAGPQEHPAAGVDQCPVAQANVDNDSKVNADDFHEAHVGVVRLGKGFLREVAAAAAALSLIKSIVGDKFYEFARRRLGLSPTAADFLLRVAELGIDPAKLSPAVEVKLPAVMGIMARIVGVWATATSGTTPTAPLTSNTTPAAVNLATAAAGWRGDHSNEE